MNKTNYQISCAEFCLAWETSDTIDEVAGKLKKFARDRGAPTMEKRIILSRASAYRKNGIKLKKLKRRHGRPNDVALINKMIEQINREKIQMDDVKAKKLLQEIANGKKS